MNEAAATFCFDCGVRLPAEVAKGAVGDPAGLGVRFGAMVIDLAIAGVALALWPSDGTSQSAAPDFSHLSDEAKGVAGLIIIVAYWLMLCGANLVIGTVMTGITGRSFGKWLTGLKVIRTDGVKPTFGIMLMRNFAYLFSLLPLGLGFLWIPLSSHKRAWHDFLCDTRVIKVVK